MSSDFKSTAYLSHRLKGSWIKNHAITIHAGYGLRVQFSEHICVLRAVFPTIKKKGQKSMPHFWRETAALWAKKFSSVHAIKFQKQNAMWKKRGWNAYFLKETYEMLIISFQPPPAKKKKMVQKGFDRELWKDVLPMADSDVLTSSAEVIIRAKYMYFQFKGTAYQIEWSLYLLEVEIAF